MTRQNLKVYSIKYQKKESFLKGFWFREEVYIERWGGTGPPNF